MKRTARLGGSSRSSLTWGLASRFVFGRKGLLGHRTARVALISTALGVVAMVVAMALMTGYRTELEDRLLVGGADFGVYPYASITDQEQARVAQTLQAMPGVESVDPVAYAQGSLLASDSTSGTSTAVTLRGVEYGSLFWNRSFELPTPDSAVVGSKLARTVGVEAGDTVRLMLMDVSTPRPKFRYRSVQIHQVIETGYHEFDRSWVVVDRAFLRQATAAPGSFEVGVAADQDLESIREQITELVGLGYEIRDFRVANQALFAALAGQQVLLFLLLGLIVLVATANVASALVVLIRERRRDLGVLAALGLDQRSLGRTLFESGLLLTLVGTALGLGLGALLAWTLDVLQLIRLGDDLATVYFLNAVPFHVTSRDLVSVALLAITSGAIASAIPAARATRVEPARALRAE